MIRYGTSLERILRALASSETMVPTERARGILGVAATIVSKLERQVEVIIVAPEADVDPLVAELLTIADDWKTVRDTLAVIEDRCTDLARQLRRTTAAGLPGEGTPEHTARRPQPPPVDGPAALP